MSISHRVRHALQGFSELCNTDAGYAVEYRPARFQSHWYPVCPRAKALAALAGTKTLTVATMQALADVGIYPIDVTPEHNSQGLISNTVNFEGGRAQDS